VQGVRLLREQRVKGDPAGALAPRRLPRPSLDKRTPGTEINRVLKEDTSFLDSFLHYARLVSE